MRAKSVCDADHGQKKIPYQPLIFNRQFSINSADPDQTLQNAPSKLLPFITKTCLYNFDPDLQGYTLFFLFLLENIDCGTR